MIIYILLATSLISLISLVGLLLSHKKIHHILHYSITFAAAALLSISFFDLIPHGLEHLEEIGKHSEQGLMFVLGGIIIFFLIERFIHWHHCDKEDCDEKPAGLLILTGDFFHNFLDGLFIASAFLLDVSTGILATITVALHEIPQEFGDFAVLIHSGFSKIKAIKLNFLSSLSALLGGIVGFFLFDTFATIIPYVILLTAGGFLYIALSDIVPSLHKHRHETKTLYVETALLIGTIFVFYFIIHLAHG